MCETAAKQLNVLQRLRNFLMKNQNLCLSNQSLTIIRLDGISAAKQTQKSSKNYNIEHSPYFMTGARNGQLLFLLTVIGAFLNAHTW